MNKVRYRVLEGDVREADVDVLALKYAQMPWGAEGAVLERLKDARRDLQLPEPWEVLLENAAPGIRAKRVLFVGVPTTENYGYREISMFARKVLSVLSHDAPETRRIAMTVHSRKHELDELDAFRAQLTGLKDAIKEGITPRSLEEILFIERDPGRAVRLRGMLLELLREGADAVDSAELPGIFISYRREDAAGWTGRLAADLIREFPAHQVFQDISSIGFGEDFLEAMRRSLASCAVMVVVIGPRWLEKDDAGKRRLDNPKDWVHLEIAESLQRKGVRIMPVLVGGASMPGDDDLPEQLRLLARLNAHEISDKRWDYDVGQLIIALKKVQSMAGA